MTNEFAIRCFTEGLRLGVLLMQDCYAVHEREEPLTSP